MSKIPLILSVAALVLAGVALVLVQSDRAGTEKVAQSAPGPLVGEPSQEDWGKRLGELEERLVALEQGERLQPAARVPVGSEFVSRAEVEELLGEAGERVAGKVPVVKSEAELREFVAGALDEVRAEEQTRKVREWQVERQERMEETVSKLDSQLGLSAYQSDRMRTALLVRFEREAELLRRWEEGEDAGVLGEIKRDDRELHLQEVAEFLAPAQLESYTEVQGSGGK